VFPSGKKYTYIIDEHCHKVFLRNVLFLSKVDDPHNIVVVREWGASSNKHVWEPPKGQMEWKELDVANIGQILKPSTLLKQMRIAVQREMVEEAKILPKDVHDLKPLPIVYKQAWPESKIPGAHFIYQLYSRACTRDPGNSPRCGCGRCANTTDGCGQRPKLCRSHSSRLEC